MCGYLKADYSYDPANIYNRFYYAWSKTVDVLLICCAIYPAHRFKTTWIILCCFYLIRLVWEVLAIEDYATATHPSIIFILFNVAALCIIIIQAVEFLKKWQRQS